MSEALPFFVTREAGQWPGCPHAPLAPGAVHILLWRPRMHLRRVSSLSVLLSLVVLGSLACRSEQPSAAPPARASASAPFDVEAVIRRVHFAFRPEGGAFSGGHSTYAVRAGAEGLTVATRHPEAASEASGSTLRLGTARLTRGARALGTGGAEGRVEGDGHLALARGEGIAEHLRNGDQGVEQSWSFERAPEGEGDLRVHLPVESLAFTGETEGGLHFADARTGLGFRYGHATWVDAAGARTGLRAAFEAGHIVLRVPQALLAASAYPAVLDPVISPEVRMDTLLVAPTPLPGDQMEPAVASNGSGFLIVWKDRRNGPDTSRIHGVRVSGTGEVLDPSGLAIGPASATSVQESPAVAFNGTDWLVVWEDLAAGRTDVVDLYAVRVSSAGTVRDATPLTLTTALGDQVEPAVASNGRDWLVTWNDPRHVSNSDIYGTRVTAAGEVLDPSGLRLSSAPDFDLHPSVASDGTDYLVVWNKSPPSAGNGTVVGVRVSAAGQVLEDSRLTLPARVGSQHGPSAAFNGTHYLVVWMDSRNSVSPDIYGSRVTAAGAVVDTAGLPLSTAANGEVDPVVTSSGGEWFVVWEDVANEWNLYGTRVSGTGEVRDTARIEVSTAPGMQYAPAVATNGTSYLVVWADKRPGQEHQDIYGRLVTREGQLHQEACLSLASLGTVSAHQDSPAVASNGKEWLVVWADSRNGNQDIYGARVTGSGEVLDAAGLAIGAGQGEQTTPAVASNGKEWLVVWSEARGDTLGISGARVTGTGRVLEALALTSGAEARLRPAVASNGQDWLVVWTDGRNEAAGDIYGARVSGAGLVLDGAGLALARAERVQDFASVAASGSDYLVVWEDARGGGQDVYGTRVTAAGEVLDASGRVLSAAAHAESAPAVASNGRGWLVVWADASGDGDIRGARVSSTGEVLDATGLALSAATGLQSAPRVASNGVGYLVVWRDARRGGAEVDVYGTQVASTGMVLDAAGVSISSESVSEELPAIAASSSSTYLVVYRRPNEGNPRIRGRLVTSSSAPVVATAQSASLAEDTRVELVLAGTSPNGEPLTFEVVQPPAHGTLTGTPPSLTYVPAGNFNGTDRFTFRVSDGQGVSMPATITLTVTPAPDAPSAPTLFPVTPGTQSPGAVRFAWTSAVDVDVEPLSYRLEVLRGQETVLSLTTTEPSRTLSAAEALAPGDYAWRVQAVDSSGLTSPFAEATFTVAQPPPVSPGPPSEPPPGTQPPGEEPTEPKPSGGCAAAPGGGGLALALVGLRLLARCGRRRT